MNIEEKLTTSIISAIKTLYGQDVPGKMVQGTRLALEI